MPVLRPTPGEGDEVLEVGRDRPAEALDQRAAAMPIRLLVLERKKPVVSDDLLDLLGVGRRQRAPDRDTLANRTGVTMLTRTSVVWAERIVAASSWNGFS